MTTTTQEPSAIAPQQATDNKQVAKSAAPPTRVSVPGSRRGGVAHKSGKLRAWLVVVTLLILVAGAVFVWAEYTGTDLRATITAVWHRLTGSDVPEGFAFT